MNRPGRGGNQISSGRDGGKGGQGEENERERCMKEKKADEMQKAWEDKT